MAKAEHKIQVTLDEATGSIVAVHRVFVEVAGTVVSHSRDYALTPESIGPLKALIDANREVMESDVFKLSIDHISATSGKAPKGVTPLKVGGSLVAGGSVEIEKKPTG